MPVRIRPWAPEFEVVRVIPKKDNAQVVEWNTRWSKKPMPKGLRVQVPLCAPKFKLIVFIC
jgi:hypothetical protein